MPDSDPILKPNLIRPGNADEAGDIIHELHEVLARYNAALFFRLEQRGMLLMTPDTKATAARGKLCYHVIALVKAITPLGDEFLRGHFETDVVVPKFDEADTEAAKKFLGRS